MTLVKDGKEACIQDHRNRAKDHYTGILQEGRGFGLNSEYSVGKWGVTAKEQVGVDGWKITMRRS